VSWLFLGAAVVLQLLAGVVRVRGWFHVIRHSWPGPTRLRYRDVVVAHMGGVGWNAVLPAHTGDAVKVIIVNRRMPDRRLALLGATTVPPAIVEGVFTALLVAGLVVTSVVSLDALTPTLHPTGVAIAAAGALAVGVIAAGFCRRHFRRLVGSVRAGLAVLAHPTVLVRCVVPWLVAGRIVRLLAYAAVLPAAGLPLSLGPALALMALQGATPSAGAAATPARIALLAAVLAGTGASDVPPEQVAAALAAAYVATSAFNLAVSITVIAWLLGTTSPRRIVAYVRSSLDKIGHEPPRSQPSVGAAPEPTRATGI
jgi:hypothetical protein